MQPGQPDGLQFNCNVPLGMTQETGGEEEKTALKALGQNLAQTQKQLHTGRAGAVHLSISPIVNQTLILVLQSRGNGCRFSTLDFTVPENCSCLKVDI